MATSVSKDGRRSNQGPRVAARNRAALLAAAREIFARYGADAPLNSVARRAGVGQGSLYRHFPDRLALVLALFEEQVSTVEERAADPDATLPDLLGLITRHAIDSVVSIDLATSDPEAGPDPRLLDLTARLAVVVGTRLDAAQERGDVPPGTEVEDVLLGIEMVASALTRCPSWEREQYAVRAWRLLGFEVVPAPR
ncbi:MULTISPECIES: helix-turn-helix domain-containing protein [unclassified Isoptericola]|uniref:helix-turn-helix domain-containing protein n=1 Tax=unclassified Isoptericola TaxID=2623355 RepID=UPI002713BC5A|nr:MULTISPECIES: helix-turn-helix domain-containing protein [unclassified Isoptericola]MDO8146942.1 helix-turn-helix domain-containing protein [Isoptericola sp. b515]MDO8150743.1 helix-turn-helix domain-containing protein [Isoptericola sp. b408]